jgi:hypothetical protein
LRARGTGKPRRSRWGLLERLAAISAALACAALAGWWIVGVVTQRLYFSEGRSWRFAGGYSRFVIPTDAAEWINTHAPQGKVFTDYDTSSNLMYFTDPRREMPALTNTFAYPPYLMRQVLEAAAGGPGFEPFVDEYGVTVVVLRSGEGTPGLIRRLSRSPDWAVVHLGIKHLVFVRRTGADAAVARDNQITPETFDVGRFIEEASRADPVPAFALHNAAAMLWQLGWQDHALTVWERVVALKPDYHDALGSLGMSLGMRGTRRLQAMQQAMQAGDEPQARSLHDAALEDWRRAEDCLFRALEIAPSASAARDRFQKNMDLLHEQIRAFRQGRILVPPDS